MSTATLIRHVNTEVEREALLKRLESPDLKAPDTKPSDGIPPSAAHVTQSPTPTGSPPPTSLIAKDLAGEIDAIQADTEPALHISPPYQRQSVSTDPPTASESNVENSSDPTLRNAPLNDRPVDSEVVLSPKSSLSASSIALSSFISQTSITTSRTSTCEAVTVLTSSPNVCFRRRGIYVGKPKEMPTPAHLEMEWRDTVRPRLINDLTPVLQNLPRKLSNSATTIEPELCMAGKADTRAQTVILQPTVWIRCGSNKCKKEVQKAINDLSYVQIFSHGTVQVRRHASRPASSCHNERLPRNPDAMGLISKDLKFYVQQSPYGKSACGMSLRIVSSDNEVASQCMATIGGLIRVGDRTYGLTTAHGIFQLLADPRGEKIGDETSENSGTDSDSDSDTDLFSLDSTTSAYQGQGDIQSSSQKPVTSQNSDSPEDDDTSLWVPAKLSVISYAGRGGTLGLPSTSMSSGSDFALIDMPFALGGPYTNEYQKRHQLGTEQVICNFDVDHVDTDPAPGPVSILNGINQIQTGYLLDGDAIILQRDAVFQTRKIQTDICLPRGSSGSWVVRDSCLLGVVIATYDNEPYAQMIPIGQIFSDINSFFLAETRLNGRGVEIASKDFIRQSIARSSTEGVQKSFCRNESCPQLSTTSDFEMSSEVHASSPTLEDRRPLTSGSSYCQFEKANQATKDTGQPAANPDEPSETHVSNHDAHGTYWSSPLPMVSGLILGGLFSLGHHVFYSHFDGSIVGSPNEEQWNIRVGSFFALVVKILLTSSVWFAYTQWLWRSLKRKAISLRGLDAAFNAQTSMIALLNPELILKVRVGAILALIAWCLQIPALITPATLFVVPSFNSRYSNMSVPSLDITNASSSDYFAYYIPLNDTSNYPTMNNQSLSLAGPRSIDKRLITASSSLGQILPITPPFFNSSYPLSFPAPYVNCTMANSTVEYLVDAFLHEMNSTWEERGLAFIEAYYALVPSHDANIGNTTTVLYDGTNYTALDQPRLQGQPMNATNELWMKFYRYSVDANGNRVLDSNGNPVVVPNYSVCSLWNASYELEFSFQNGEQTVRNHGPKLLNPVGYPINNPNEPSDPVRLAYSAVFMALTDQLVGYMGIFVNSETSTPQYGSIDTNIEQNSLLGSDDLDFFFSLNSQVTEPNATLLSPQRLLDKALAQNQTLPFLVQQLSFNTTLSLMNDPLFAPQVMATVKQSTPVNRYSYDVRNLWLAYGLAIFFALCAVVLGLFAFISNDESHNNTFSTLLSVSRDPSLDPLFPPCCHGKLPLPRETMDASLRVSRGDGGVENLVPPSNVKVTPSCRTCAIREAREARASIAASPNQGRRRSTFTLWTPAPKPMAQKAR